MLLAKKLWKQLMSVWKSGDCCLATTMPFSFADHGNADYEINEDGTPTLFGTL
jgi:hypothetical protein